jgi:predicted nucleic acid-binding protein
VIEFFADTSYWIALQLPEDALHRSAVKLFEAMPDGSRLITSELVMVEFLNHMSRAGHGVRKQAAETWTKIEKSSRVDLVPSTEDLLGQARFMFENLVDKSWSLTDCASIIIMRRKKINEVLSSDHHFEQAGLRALMRS